MFSNLVQLEEVFSISAHTSWPSPFSSPLIGIGGIPMQCQFGGVWDEPVTMLHRSYSAAVARGGGVALVLTPDTLGARPPATLIAALDAVLLVGGGDVDPARYGADPDPRTARVDQARDEAELGLVHAALEAELPVLGICRGMEILNVARGGTLIQHLPDTLGHSDHLEQPGRFERHGVELAPESAAAHLVGASYATVMSHHHQGVGELGAGVIATGWAPGDRFVEAIELPDARLTLGVQWHPEEDGDSQLIANFVTAVAKARTPA
jgi:putative glutamine amidotransferase